MTKFGKVYEFRADGSTVMVAKVGEGANKNPYYTTVFPIRVFGKLTNRFYDGAQPNEALVIATAWLEDEREWKPCEDVE